jgi:hypothetical protein
MWDAILAGTTSISVVDETDRHTIGQQACRLLKDSCAGSKTAGGERWPFSPGDVTAGSEIELQAAVIGSASDVDLPATIALSKYYANLLKRSRAEEIPKRHVRNLERFLDDTATRVWENSWVRIPIATLNAAARQVLDRDLRSDRQQSDSSPRGDVRRFFGHNRDGQEAIRVPVSYLLKLALADVCGNADCLDTAATTGRRLLDNFLSDNVSPETLSFYVVSPDENESCGQALAGELSQRFLLIQLLTMYANGKFRLRETGQEAVVYCAPNPPLAQQQLNDCIPDSFYREHFISPCLSGWDRGEDKQEYMRLCHQVLSRSQLNALGKLRDTGLLWSNVVVLPNVSTISLSNNGIHATLGSLGLSQLRGDRSSGFGPVEEKFTGDLATKIIEHFLPLFVGTYSAAPCRFDFADCHVERLLGFLPHELDFTHLRMLWRRWKGKSGNSLLGQPISPTGYRAFDNLLARMLWLRGDYVPDARLVGYLMAPLSTDESPALDGRLGNTERLKSDLTDMGVFDTRMSMYSLYRQRMFDAAGYCGFEGRFYSLCESFSRDLAPAVSLQMLITALAYKYIANGDVTHADIPDDPAVESERRQIFFGSAIDVPTFFVRADSSNRFLRRILQLVEHSRPSRRYPRHVRVQHLEFRRALIRLLRRDAAEFLEAPEFRNTLDDLAARVNDPESASVSGRLTRQILDACEARTPWQVPADEFNSAAESLFRGALRRRQIAEALQSLQDDWSNARFRTSDTEWQEGLLGIGLQGGSRFVESVRDRLLSGDLPSAELTTLIQLTLLTIRRHAELASTRPDRATRPALRVHTPPVVEHDTTAVVEPPAESAPLESDSHVAIASLH